MNNHRKMSYRWLQTIEYFSFSVKFVRELILIVLAIAIGLDLNQNKYNIFTLPVVLKIIVLWVYYNLLSLMIRTANNILEYNKYKPRSILFK